MSEARKKRGESGRILDALRCALASKSSTRSNTVPFRNHGERVESTGTGDYTEGQDMCAYKNGVIARAASP